MNVSLMNRRTLEQHDQVQGCDEAYLADDTTPDTENIEPDIYDDTDILIDEATVAEFRHYCKRFCRLCNVDNGDNPASLNRPHFKDDLMMACPIIQFEAYRRLMKEGGANAMSLGHSKKTGEIVRKLKVNHQGRWKAV